MNILAISPYIPWPLHGGPQLRIYHLMRELTRRGHEITLLAGDNGDPPAEGHPIYEACQRVCTFPVDEAPASHIALRSLGSRVAYPFPRYVTRAYRRQLDAVLADDAFHLVFVNFLALAEPLATSHRRIPVVVDEHESQALVWRDVLATGSIPERVFGVVSLAKVEATERWLLRHIDGLASVSDGEAEAARSRGGGRVPVWVVPNGVAMGQVPPAEPPAQRDPVIMLCANYGVKRNVDAALWFANDILPRVHELVPDARFTVVGADPPAQVRALADRDGIEVTGTVDSVAPYYEASAVVVAPFRFGAGTKLKVLEALASNRPLVTTRNGARGLDIVAGETAEVADDENGFALAVAGLLKDADHASRLARTARTYVEQEHSWTAIADTLEARLLPLAQETRP